MAFVLMWPIPAARAQQRMRVVVDVRNSGAVPPTVLTAALREAKSIWVPYGVTIEDAARLRDAMNENETMFVPVTLEPARARGHVQRQTAPLGWTGFARTGRPTMRISIFYDMIAIAASGGGLFGARDLHAVILQERLAGRVLGRALAHEVGHVVLRSSDHSPSGLMRAAQPVPELQHPSRAGFGLDPRDVARLHHLLDGNARAATTAQR